MEAPPSRSSDPKAKQGEQLQMDELQSVRSVSVVRMDSFDEKQVRKTVLKLDLYLMTLLILGFFVLQLDRSNISNALTDTIVEDLHITSDDVSTGTQLMSAAIVIAEIPSNIVLQRLGARVWLPILLLIWGTIALAQAFVTNKSTFYATRFLLGLFEGGFIPGAQYILSLFYTEHELALRTSIFYFGNYFAAATGSLIAAGLLTMAGQHGLSGWQWLFLVDGVITLCIAVLFVLFMPLSPFNTRPIHNAFDFFTDTDRAILQARILTEDQSKRADKAAFTVQNFMEAIKDVRLWLHGLLNILALAPKGGLALYSPSIIKSLGFDTIHANLLNSVGSYLVVILSLLISLGSDKTGLRGLFCIVSFVWSIAFSSALLGVGVDSGKWLRYALITLLSGGNALAQALNDAWLSINARSPHKRSIGLAFVVMGSNIGGLIGPSLFQSSDAPRYVHGFLAILILYVASIGVTLLIMFIYWRDNKKLSLKVNKGDGKMKYSI